MSMTNAVRPALSVVVPTRDRPELLDSCLTALRVTLGEDDEVIVVDSASAQPDAVIPVVERHGAHYVRAPRKGASLARNLGCATARNELVGFVDDDVHVVIGWAAAMCAPMSDKGIGFVVGRVDLPPDAQEVDYPASVYAETEPRTLDRSSQPDGGIGNCVIRRRAFIDIGGLDERLGAGTWVGGAEDLDLFERLIDEGWLGRFEPAAEGIHVQWRTAGENVAVHYAYGKGRGAHIAKLLHRDRGRALHLLPQIVRIRGVATAVTEAREGRRRSWLPPIVWRLGAIVGLLVGLPWLRGTRRSSVLPPAGDPH